MPASDDLNAPRIFRPTFSRGFGIFVTYVCLVGMVWWLIREPLAAWPSTPWVLGAALLGYSTLWRPHVHVDDDAVTLVNVLRTVRVPFSALEDLDTKFALTLISGGRKFVAWAAPAPSRLGAAMLARQAKREQATGSPGSISRSLSSDSGAAMQLVELRWARAQSLAEQARGRGEVISPEPVKQEWNWPIVIGYVVCGVGALITTLI